MVEEARKYGLYVDNVHAELKNCNYIWSDKKEERNYIYKEYEKGILFCAEHDIPTLVIHICSSDTPPPLNQSGVDLIGDLLSLANKERVILAVENTRHQDYLDVVFSSFNSPYLGLCYDSGHDHLFGAPTLRILEKWGKLLTTVHLADNGGEFDNHWLPWLGDVDWPGVMNGLWQQNYSGTVLLEVYPKNVALESPRQFLERAFTKARQLRHLIPR